jgi:hypothetical protein
MAYGGGYGSSGAAIGLKAAYFIDSTDLQSISNPNGTNVSYGYWIEDSGADIGKLILCSVAKTGGKHCRVGCKS